MLNAKCQMREDYGLKDFLLNDESEDTMNVCKHYGENTVQYSLS